MATFSAVAGVFGLYIHELPDWPHFRWDWERVTAPLAAVRYRQGLLSGQMEALGFPLRREAELDTLTSEVLNSSEIEGEKLDAQQVRSSVARRLGIDLGERGSTDRHVDGVVEMMLDATRNCGQPLEAERLFAWHASMFPTGRSGMKRITVGAWRDDRLGAMQVVSGPIGKERVHFEAPKADRIEKEMATFLEWFNAEPDSDLILTAALAHLWFVTIHPFDDGNGRIARAISDMVLARSDGVSQRFYSMSAQILRERRAYYDTLEATQKGSMEVTFWMEWFLGCLGRAISGTRAVLDAVLEKGRFWRALEGAVLNRRQRLVLNRLLDGFEGKLTTSKYGLLARCSQDTATRDIQALVEKGILVRGSAGGRSTSYALARDERPAEG